MIKRILSVHFERSVNQTTNKPEMLEIVVVPLTTASSGTSNATYVQSKQVKKVTLDRNVTVTFELVPTYDPSLGEPIPYAISWKIGFLGKVTYVEFAMPDADVDYDDLDDLGQILDPLQYLRQTDLNVPGRVAQLTPEGLVQDAFGNIIDGVGNANVVNDKLNAEVLARKQADNSVRADLGNEITSQITSVQTTTAALLNAAVEQLEQADQDDTAAWTLAIQGLSAVIDSIGQNLPNKADLVNGKIPANQIPDIALGHGVVAADEAEMLALTPAQVQPGDFCVRPDGTFILNGADPSVLSNWLQLSSGAAGVVSINGQTGIVTLDAIAVGARPLGDIPLAEVIGLQAALNAKATNATVDGVTNRVTTAEGKITTLEGQAATTVHKDGSNEIATSLIKSDVPRVNAQNQLLRKDGSVIPISGSGLVDSVNDKTGHVVLTAADVGARPAGAIAITDVTNLNTTLDGKVDNTDGRLTNSRNPIAHASSHATGGSDPITPASIGARPAGTPIPQSDVTNLVPDLSAKAPAAVVTGIDSRLSQAELDIDELQAGAGGEVGFSRKLISWETNAQHEIESTFVKSPYGINTDGDAYYNPNGAVAGEAAWPYITPNGHIELRKIDRDGLPDPVMATKQSVDDLVVVVNGKATTASVSDLSAIVATKASQASVDQINDDLILKADQTTVDNLATTVSGKASQSEVNALTSEMAGKAAQADLVIVSDAVATKASAQSVSDLTVVVNGKATQASVDSLTSSVNSKASQADLTALTGRVSTTESALPNKADLDAGVLKATQVPNIAQSKVVGLDTSLAGKADLSGGVLATAQIPTNIPQGSVTGLTTTLAAKADLVGGKLATSQIPALASHETYAVANRAAMLAMTAAQVQIGDEVIITATADKGSYVYVGPTLSDFNSWMKRTVPDDNVLSVNGQVGAVVLGATDVGARPAGGAIAQSEVTGLSSALTAKADTTALTSGLAGKTSSTDVENQIRNSLALKMTVKLVSTVPQTLSGLQSIDGVLTAANDKVLLTGQSASSQNGIYVVQSGAWTRATDLQDGVTIHPGTGVMVQSGTAHSSSIWQMTSTSSAVVGSASQLWTKSLQAGVPESVAAGPGLQKVGSTLSARAGTGIILTGGLINVDPSVVPKKYAVNVPSGSSSVTITHSLGTSDVGMFLRELASGDAKLIGWTTTSANAITLYFSSAPAVDQYRVTVIG